MPAGRVEASVRVRRCARFSVVLFTATVAAISTAQRSMGEPTSVLRVESSATGEIELDAHWVPVAEVLHAIAAEDGFEVVMEEGIARPLVNATVETAPVEDVLREVLRDRNYALVYGADATSLSQVFVLPPSSPRSPSTPRARPGAARAGQPIVVRR